MIELVREQAGLEAARRLRRNAAGPAFRWRDVDGGDERFIRRRKLGVFAVPCATGRLELSSQPASKIADSARIDAGRMNLLTTIPFQMEFFGEGRCGGLVPVF